MKELIKPKKLQAGDMVATVSSSWGGAGDENILWRYQQGIERLKNIFGLKVVEMPNTLSGTDYIYQNPKKRAEDLMNAFLNPEIKGIFSCIGGNDSIRILPYIDFNIIHNNPKVFMGYSDTTTTNMICYKAGISSVYGPSVLNDFAENVAMDDYTIQSVKKTLFSDEPIGNILPSKEWTSENLPWIIENKNISRKRVKNSGYELLQGNDTVNGRLIGGCLEIFDSLRGTELFPQGEEFNDAILFLETSEDNPPAWYLEMTLRVYGVNGYLTNLKGMIFGKPYHEMYQEEYKAAIMKVLAEFHREDMPVLCNLNFGHTEPKFCIPYGAMAEIDCESKSFSILESGTI